MNGKHYYTLNKQKELSGYICFGSAARVPSGYNQGIYRNYDYLDIGLGLKPELTGKGLGFEYLKQGMEFIRNKFQVKAFRLVVATSNERAIKVYERVGFVRGESFTSEIKNKKIDLIVMTIESVS